MINFYEPNGDNMHTFKTLIFCLFLGISFGAQTAKASASNAIHITTVDLLAKGEPFRVLEAKLKENPRATVVLTVDAQSVKGGLLTLKKSGIPSNLEHLIILDPKKRVKNIGHSFLAHANLESLNISDLTALVRIGDDFLSYNSGLKKFDTSGLGALQIIGGHFLSATGLEDFNASGLTALIIIGESFVTGANLRAFDGSSLRALKKIGAHFLSFNPMLDDITLLKGHKKLFKSDKFKDLREKITWVG